MKFVDIYSFQDGTMMIFLKLYRIGDCEMKLSNNKIFWKRTHTGVNERKISLFHFIGLWFVIVFASYFKILLQSKTKLFIHINCSVSWSRHFETSCLQPASTWSRNMLAKSSPWNPSVSLPNICNTHNQLGAPPSKFTPNQHALFAVLGPIFRPRPFSSSPRGHWRR